MWRTRDRARGSPSAHGESGDLLPEHNSAQARHLHHTQRMGVRNNPRQENGAPETGGDQAPVEEFRFCLLTLFLPLLLSPLYIPQLLRPKSFIGIGTIYRFIAKGENSKDYSWVLWRRSYIGQSVVSGPVPFPDPLLLAVSTGMRMPGIRTHCLASVPITTVIRYTMCS